MNNLRASIGMSFRKNLRSALTRFRREAAGNVAVIASVVLPIVTGTGMFAIDYANAVTQGSALQKATDAAALAAVREMRFVSDAGTSETDLRGLLRAIAGGIMRNTLDLPQDALTVNAVLVGENAVRIDTSFETPSLLGTLKGKGPDTLHADATAELFGSQNICVLLLHDDDRRAGVEMFDSTSIKGAGCGLHSNSPRRNSISAGGGSVFDMSYLCAVGGFKGPESGFKVPVLTDCPAIEDPFRMRPHPEDASRNGTAPCGAPEPLAGIRVPGARVDRYEDDYEGFGGAMTFDAQIIETGSHTLSPGVYCGALVIAGDADVWMEEGTYIFHGGPLVVKDRARLKGDYTGLYFDGHMTYFQFLDEAEVELSAPKDGVMAGLLVHMPRHCAAHRTCHTNYHAVITSSRVRSLLGTIYIPNDLLEIDTTVPVSQEAAFTIIVSARLRVKQSAALVLNTDYAATNVPQPTEIQGLLENVRLIE